MRPEIRNSRLRPMFLAMVLAIWGSLSPLQALSAPPAAALSSIETLQGSFARAILTETRTGLATLSQLERAAGVRPQSFATAAERYTTLLERLESPALQSLREQLGQRLLALTSLDDLNRIGRGEAAPLKLGSLSPEQRLILDELASRALQINPRWVRELDVIPDLSARGGIEFFDEAAFANASRRIREDFLAPMRESAPFDDGLRTAVGRESESLMARARGKLNEMERCLETRSSADTAKAQKRWWIQSMFISQGITLVGNVVGSKEVDWKTLPTDLLVNAVWSYVSSKFLFSSTKFSVQFVRMEAMGQGRSGVDAIVYFVSPLKETHGQDNFTATVDRTEYNAIYNAASPVVTVPLQRLTQGLDCLYQGGKGMVLTTGLRYLQSTATAMVYFHYRSDYVGNGSYLLGE
jgi:hypothetical protein